MNIFVNKEKNRLTVNGVIAMAFGAIVGLLGCYSLAEIITKMIDLQGTEEAPFGVLFVLYLFMIWHITHEDEDETNFLMIWVMSWGVLVLFVIFGLISRLF
jgi:hypothetical protein